MQDSVPTNLFLLTHPRAWKTNVLTHRYERLSRYDLKRITGEVL